MGYSRFRLKILVRILLLLASWTAAVYSILSTRYFFLFCILAILSFFLLGELLRFISLVHRDMDQCIQSILARDFTIHFPLQGKSERNEIRMAANLIIKKFRELQHDKERLLRLTDTVMENLPVAVICFQNDHSCCIFNKAAEENLGLKVSPEYERFKELFPGLVPSGSPGQTNAVFKLERRGEVLSYAVRWSSFIIGTSKYRLITLENISSELDSRETESWKDLMRVLNHEIVNSITPIVSLSSSLAEELSDDADILSKEDMREAARAISTRSDGLLRFAKGYRIFTKQQEPQPERFDVVKKLSSLKELYKNNKNLQLQIDASHTAYVSCDPTHFEQVMINLIRNAEESSLPGEVSLVRIGCIASDDVCEIYVEDHGVGMDDETLSKIFVPYFTTKEHGQGLGLSLCRQLIQLNKGKIMVRSKPGKGTRVTLILKSS